MPKIIIEPLIRTDKNKIPQEISVYCFNGKPKIIVWFQKPETSGASLYDENLNIIDDVLIKGDIKINRIANENIHKALHLSGKLSKNFDFVRIDWMLDISHQQSFSQVM